MHLVYHISKNNKFMKIFRLLKYLIYGFPILHYTIPVNSKVIDSLEMEHQLIKDFIQILSI